VNILGLDISTSCTGWCILGPEGTLVDMGYITLSKEKDLYTKAQVVLTQLETLKKIHDISLIYIEENLQAFRPGLSSAKTLLTLARFNGIVGYTTQQLFDIIPEYVNVNAARKANGIKIIRKSKGGAPTKDQVFEWVSNKVNYNWPVKTLKSGPRKGQTVLEPGCYDAADAYVIAVAGPKVNN